MVVRYARKKRFTSLCAPRRIVNSQNVKFLRKAIVRGLGNHDVFHKVYHHNINFSETKIFSISCVETSRSEGADATANARAAMPVRAEPREFHAKSSL